MFKSRLVTTFALFLALAYALPALCVVRAAATTTHRSPAAPCGGCHGHHQHVPAPQRYCCANPQVPAALQASASHASLSLVAYWQADEAASNPDSVTALPINGRQFSSSPPAVLRI
jgi:hypothetical protein